jgi:hypothetical protein
MDSFFRSLRREHSVNSLRNGRQGRSWLDRDIACSYRELRKMGIAWKEHDWLKSEDASAPSIYFVWSHVHCIASVYSDFSELFLLPRVYWFDLFENFETVLSWQPPPSDLFVLIRRQIRCCQGLHHPKVYVDNRDTNGPNY